MQSTRQFLSIKDALKITQRNSDDPYTFLREIITNAIEGLLIQEERHPGGKWEITLTASFDADMFGVYQLKNISVKDNGAGFDEESQERFHSYSNASKGFRNKGTGKMQFLYWFEEICVDSHYLNKSQKFMHYVADVSEENEIRYKNESLSINQLQTIVTLNKPKPAAANFLESLQNINTLKNVIIEMFLPFFLENKQRLSFHVELIKYDSKGIIAEHTNKEIEKSDINYSPENSTVDVFKEKRVSNGKKKPQMIKIPESKEQLSISTYHIPETHRSEHGIFFRRKYSIVPASKLSENVLGFDFSKHRKTAVEGAYFVVIVGGKIFDDEENISNDSSWIFPLREACVKESDIFRIFTLENEGVFTKESIEASIQPILNSTFKPLYEKISERAQNASIIQKKYGFRETYGLQFSLDDSEEKIVEKLYRAQGKILAGKSVEMMKAFEHYRDNEAKNLNPLDPDSMQTLSTVADRLLNLTEEQNRDELAKYIIRRDIVIKMMELAIRKELKVQENNPSAKRAKEGILHDLIFRRKKQNDISSNEWHELWIFNEDFTHYQQAASDIPLEQITIKGEPLFKNPGLVRETLDKIKAKRSYNASEDKMRDRPDIFIFSETGACVLIELKAPDVDFSHHTNQILDYVRTIATYAEVGGRPIRRFYGYLIGGELDSMVTTMGFTSAPFDEYRFARDTTITSLEEHALPISGASLYQEIIPYKTIIRLAQKRNANFMEKLGLKSKNDTYLLEN